MDAVNQGVPALDASTERRFIRFDQPSIFFLLLLPGFISMVLSQLALAWDGSFILVQTLVSQRPVINYGRVAEIIPLDIVLFLSRLGGLSFARYTYSALYALTPLLALGLSHTVLRKRAPQLFVWAAFGVCLVTLPGQSFPVSESIIVMQLAWPLLMSTATDLEGISLAIGPLTVIAMFALHPSAAAAYLLTATLALARATQRTGSSRKRLLAWAALLTGVSILRLALIRSGYETQVADFNHLRYSVESSLIGWPVLALALGGLACVLHPAAALRRNPSVARLWLSLAGIAAAAIILVVWAADPHSWKKAIDYRNIVLLTSLPFVAVFAVPALRRRETTAVRYAPLVPLALLFSLVMVVQGLSWHSLTNRLSSNVSEIRSTNCTAVEDLHLPRETAISHWATPWLAILLQDKPPRRVLWSPDLPLIVGPAWTCDQMLRLARAFDARFSASDDGRR